MRTEQKGARVWADAPALDGSRQLFICEAIKYSSLLFAFSDRLCVNAHYEPSHYQAQETKFIMCADWLDVGIRLAGEFHPGVGLGDHGLPRGQGQLLVSL